jgi:hypothetical protein
MAGAEVLPVVLDGEDKTGSMWASFTRNAKGGQSVIEQLKGALAGLETGNTSALSSLGTAARLLANPYAAAAAFVLGVGAAGIKTAHDLSLVGAAADEIKTKASYVEALGDALKKVGGDSSVAIDGLKNLRSQVDTQSRDGGYLNKLFMLNGSSLTDAAGKLKTIEQIYAEIGGFILKAHDGTQRLEIATNAYGSQAAPLMVKAIQAGADSLTKITKADIDPLIRQSQELEKVWISISREGDGWFGKLLKANSEAVSYSALFWASTVGRSKRAAEGLYLADNPNAHRTMDAGAADSFYNAVGVPSTITPSTTVIDKATVATAKQTAEVRAQAAAVDLGAGSLARLQTQAKLLAVAEESGIPLTQTLRDKIGGLATDAGNAAAALAKAKVASETAFDRKTIFISPEDKKIAEQLKGLYGTDVPRALASTEAAALRVNSALKFGRDVGFERGAAFLTPEDKQIAEQLRGLYGTDIPAALNSSEAGALRLNNVFKEISNTGQDVNRGVFVDFTTNLRNGVQWLDNLKSTGLNALGKISDKLASMAADGLWKAAFGGNGNWLSSVASMFGIGGGGVNANGSITGAVGATSVGGAPLVGAFADGTNNAPGGWSIVGERGPEIMNVPKGAQVFPNGQIPDFGSGDSSQLVMQDNRTINIGSGASQETVATLQSALAQDRRDRYADTVKIVADARQRGILK